MHASSTSGQFLIFNYAVSVVVCPLYVSEEWGTESMGSMLFCRSIATSEGAPRCGGPGNEVQQCLAGNSKVGLALDMYLKRLFSAQSVCVEAWFCSGQDPSMQPSDVVTEDETCVGHNILKASWLPTPAEI